MKFIHSALPEIHWPALPGQRTAPMLALQFQLQQSQWLSPEALHEHQQAQLLKVLHHANKTVPFYRSRLREAGLKPGRHFDAEAFRRLPLLTRAQLNAAGETLTSQQIPAAHGKTHRISTSGSTGTPISVLGTGVSQFYWQAFTLRDHFWHRRDFSHKLAVIRRLPGNTGRPPHGSPQKSWGPPADTVLETGPSSLLSIDSSIEQQLAWLQRERPAILLTYPSNLAALARLCRDEGIQLDGLHEVRTLAEIVTPATRALCHEVFDVPLTDMYSCQEAGYLALQCPHNDHYHVQAENVLLEVLDDNDQPCAPGQTGRVVISTLHNFATPLIRYEIGDLATPGAPCDCGRGLPVLKEIKGRVRNLLTLPGGERVWPHLEAIGFGPDFAVRQYQIVQTATQTLEVRLVVEQPLSAANEQRLRDRLHSVLGHPFDIDIRYLDTIARSKGGKFEDFYAEI